MPKRRRPPRPGRPVRQWAAEGGKPVRTFAWAANLLPNLPPGRALLGVGVIGFDRARRAEAQVAKFLPKRLSGDPQDAGGLVLVAVGVAVNEGEENSIEFRVDDGIEIGHVGFEPVVDKRFESNAMGAAGSQRGPAVFRMGDQIRQERRHEDPAGRPQQGLFERTLQLANISRPRVGGQNGERSGDTCRTSRPSSRSKLRM